MKGLVKINQKITCDELNNKINFEVGSLAKDYDTPVILLVIITFLIKDLVNVAYRWLIPILFRIKDYAQYYDKYACND